MNITLPKFFTTAKPAPSRAAERYRQYRTTGNGKIEVYLPPQRGDELRNKLIAAQKEADAKIEAAAVKRDSAVKAAKADYNALLKTIESESTKEVLAADRAYMAIEEALLAEYAAPLSPEQIALLTTPIGSVVRVPAQANGGGQ